MALSAAIAKAGRENRRRQSLAERRMDEQLLLEVARAQLTEEYSAIDALGDERFMRLARVHFATLETERQRETMTALFAEWSRDDALQDRWATTARETNLSTIRTFHRNTPMFVDGAFVPDGSEPVA